MCVCVRERACMCMCGCVHVRVCVHVYMRVCVCVFSRSVVSDSCDPIDCSPSPPDFSVHGILQVRIREWVAISFSRESFWPRNQTSVSCAGTWILCHLSHQGRWVDERIPENTGWAEVCSQTAPVITGLSREKQILQLPRWPQSPG